MYSTTLSYLADICVAVENTHHAQTLIDKTAASLTTAGVGPPSPHCRTPG